MDNKTKAIIAAGSVAAVVVVTMVGKYISKRRKAKALLAVIEQPEVTAQQCKIEGSAQEFFDAEYRTTSREVEYNPIWTDVEGGFSGIHRASTPVLMVGEQATSIDPTGRRIIFVGTPLGPVVVYQDSYRADGQIVVITTKELDNAMIPGMNDDIDSKLFVIFGDLLQGVSNIGFRLSALMKNAA